MGDYEWHSDNWKIHTLQGNIGSLKENKQERRQGAETDHNLTRTAGNRRN